MCWFLMQAEIPPLPRDLEGETFSHVFGTHTSWWDQEFWIPKLYFYMTWCEIVCVKEACMNKLHVHFELFFMYFVKIWEERILYTEILYFSLELLLIDSKMKGPGWLDIKLPRELTKE